MTVSLLEILAAARAHAAPLAAESAGYLLLAVTDHLALSPRVLGADDVELHPDGTVRVRGRGAAAPAGEAEQIARDLLARTLGVSSSVGPALRRAAERRESTGLEGLVRELEVALIPVNRSAARRALSRVYRETARARDQGKLEAWLRAEQAPAVAIADPVALAADFPEPASSGTPAPAMPVVTMTQPSASPTPLPAPALPAPLSPLPELFLSPPPPPPAALAVAPPPPASPSDDSTTEELALTKPEPVVERARERGSSTPKLGTVVTAQTLAEEERERTERAPTVELDDAQDELDIPIEVELEREPVMAVADEPQQVLEPTPSCLPDVLTAMIELHAGIEPDAAPTRLRDVVTAERLPVLAPSLLPEVVDDGSPVPSSVQGVATAGEAQVGSVLDVDVIELGDAVDPALHEALTWNPGPVEPNPGDAANLDIVELCEVVDPAVHEALTWSPGPVGPRSEPVPVAELEPAPVTELEPASVTELELMPDLPSEPTPFPTSLLIAEPVEPSPYSPAVLPARESDVSELVDSFHVTSGVEERELRAALKEMAGLDVTPLPHAQGE